MTNKDLITFNRKHTKVGSQIKPFLDDRGFFGFLNKLCTVKEINDNGIVASKVYNTNEEYSLTFSWDDYEIIRHRGFEVVDDSYRKHPNTEISLPKRGSSQSAGYDICTPIKIVIPAFSISETIQTDIKAYMLPDEVLEIYPRSSIGFKKGVMLVNTVGIIDSDYYENPNNDGNIGFKLKNLTDKEVVIEAGERIMQGIFKKYLLTDEDDCTKTRVGGIGSTNK